MLLVTVGGNRILSRENSFLPGVGTVVVMAHVGLLMEIISKCQLSLVTVEELCALVASHYCQPGLQLKFS